MVDVRWLIFFVLVTIQLTEDALVVYLVMFSRKVNVYTLRKVLTLTASTTLTASAHDVLPILH